MQIRTSSEAAAAARHRAGSMTVDELLARFPEIPLDLKDEPVLAQYVDAFGPQLREAIKPTPCMGVDGGDAGHRFYAVLVNDLAIYGIGLAKRERTLARLAARLEEYRKHPAIYACTLVPHRTPDTPRTGCSA
jgi:hypothetical protein